MDYHLAKDIAAEVLESPSGTSRHETAKNSDGGELGKKKEAQQRLPPIRAVNLATFLSLDIPPREMVLAPILPTQGLAMLYAPRGVGKTYASLSIAMAVASGGSLFNGWEAPKPRRVVYIDGEMPATTMQKRLCEIAIGASVQLPADDLFQLVTPDLQEAPLPDLSTEAGQERLAPIVQPAEFVVLDNLSTLCRSGRENESESWLGIQEWVLSLRKSGKSVLFVHHAGKGGQQRGTSKREDILDTVIALRRPAEYEPTEGARFEVHIEKGREVKGDDAKPFEARLDVREDAAYWTVRSIEDQHIDVVIRLTKEGMNVRDIADELKLSKSKVNRLQKNAREAGLLPQKPSRCAGTGT